MPQTITLGYQALCQAAEREIETLAAEDAIKLAGRHDTVLVDIRDIRELTREGRVPGAVHCPRGMLEFWIDPQSPYHKPYFAQDKKFVFFCAGGLRSALAAQTAQRMGLKPVAHGTHADHRQQELFVLVAAAVDRDESRRHCVRRARATAL